MDPVSVELFKDESSVDFKNTKESLWMNTEKLATFLGKAADYDAIFYVGGFGRDLNPIVVTHMGIQLTV